MPSKLRRIATGQLYYCSISFNSAVTRHRPRNPRIISCMSQVTRTSHELGKRVTKSRKKRQKNRKFLLNASGFHLPWAHMLAMNFDMIGSKLLHPSSLSTSALEPNANPSLESGVRSKFVMAAPEIPAGGTAVLISREG